MNDLRQKLESGKMLRGTLVSLTDPCLCEIMGNIGFDCVWIDMEHTYMSYKDVLCHLNAAKSSGISSVVRLPQNDLTATKKILEMGPDGVIFPMVRSADELKALLDMTLYPPLGSRGFGPMRAIGYGSMDAKEYVTSKSLEMCRFAQIEDINLLSDIEEIATIPYIDGFIFGPNDLSASLGDFLNVFSDDVLSIIKDATQKLKKYNKYVGLAGGMRKSDIGCWASMELDMLFAGSDWCYIYDRGIETLETLNQYL